MRILHVHSGNLFGGVERVLRTLANVDEASSGLVHEFAFSFAGPLQEQLQGQVRTHPIGGVQTRRPWTIVRARRRLRALLRRERYDVALVHSAWAQAIFGPVLHSAAVPQVYWVHDTLDGRHWLQRWARRTKPDLLLCSSQFVSTTLALVYPDVAHQVVHYPLDHVAEVDPASRTSVRAELGVGDDDVAIVQVGRLEPYKGHTLLLDALAELRALPGWRLWEVGGAQREQERLYLEQLAAQASALGIRDRIDFVGQRSDVARLLAGADIYCQPNVLPEPFGLTFIEAMYAGLPVVTTAFGGGAEAVGETGWLVEPGNRPALAAALRKLIEEPELRKRFAEAGRKRARDLTDPIRQSQRLHTVLSQLISK